MATWESSKLQAYANKMRGASDRTARRTAKEGERIVKRTIEQVGAVRTGFLRDSVQGIPLPGGGALLEVGADYAIFVNYGTYKMAARPFWEPSLAEIGREMLGIAKEEFAP